jgi:hypothetical protein
MNEDSWPEKDYKEKWGEIVSDDNDDGWDFRCPGDPDEQLNIDNDDDGWDFRCPGDLGRWAVHELEERGTW